MKDTYVVCITISQGFGERMHVAFNQTHTDANGPHQAGQQFTLPPVAQGEDCLTWIQQVLACVCDAV